MKLLRFPIFLLPLLLSCDIINKDEVVPSFIQINEIEVLESVDGSDDLINCGSTTHRFTDARVFINSNLVGLFELPATIPVLDNGATTITVIPGVNNVGISTERMDYPFTLPYTVVENLIEDNVLEIVPQVQYYDDFTIWQENFAAPLGVDFQATENSDLMNGSIQSIIDSTAENCPYEDLKVGKLSTTIDNPIVEIVSTDLFSVDPFGNTFLEFNYKNEETFFIGIKKGPEESDNLIIAGVNPSFEDNSLVWKKMHIELAPYMQSLEVAGVGSYNLIFKSELSSPESILLLDNIRVLHR